MASLCRLCSSSNTKLTSSLNDDLIVRFLDYIPRINLSEDPKLSIQVCQLCYGKAQIALNFIVKIEKSQGNNDPLTEKVHRNQQQSQLATPNEVLRKMQKQAGLSIKRVAKPRPASSSCSEDGEYKNDSQGSDSSEDDDDPPSRKRKQPKQFHQIGSIMSFTCATCKGTFPDMEILTKHILKCANSSKVKCEICSSHLESNRQLQKHYRRVHRGIPFPKVETNIGKLPKVSDSSQALRKHTETATSVKKNKKQAEEDATNISNEASLDC